MRIAIYGLTKTGTTALYYKIKEALPPATDGYFEPQWRDVARYQARLLATQLGLRPKRPLLAKLIPFYQGRRDVSARFGRFDRSILIARDPRDRLISSILYQLYDRLVGSEGAAEVIALLEAKQADPKRVPLLQVLAAVRRATGLSDNFAAWAVSYARASIAAPLAFADAHRGIFVLRYEDLVDCRLDELSAYLGVALAGKARVDSKVARVVRTSSYGNWRDWMTESDVFSLKPVLVPYLERYYPGADWTLAAEPFIAPEHGSLYVRRILDEQRHKGRLSSLIQRAGAA